MRFRDYIKEFQIYHGNPDKAIKGNGATFIFHKDKGLAWHDPPTGNVYLNNKKVGNSHKESWMSHYTLAEIVFGGRQGIHDDLITIKGRLKPDRSKGIIDTRLPGEPMAEKKYLYIKKKTEEAVYRYMIKEEYVTVGFGATEIFHNPSSSEFKAVLGSMWKGRTALTGHGQGVRGFYRSGDVYIWRPDFFHPDAAKAIKEEVPGFSQSQYTIFTLDWETQILYVDKKKFHIGDKIKDWLAGFRPEVKKFTVKSYYA